MQYQIRCKHCGQLFAIEAAAGRTVRSHCPYCGTEATIAVPVVQREQPQEPVPHVRTHRMAVAQQSASDIRKKPKGLHISSLGLKVTVVFIIASLAIIIVSSALYILFSAMSR